MTVTSDAWKIVSATDAVSHGASDGGHRGRRSRGGSDDGKAAVRGVQDRQELRQL